MAAATRWTVPSRGALIVDSIFIASSVAIGSPRATVSPAATSTETIPVTGAGHVAGLARIGALDLDVAVVAGTVANLDGPQLPVDSHKDRAHAALVGFADRLELEQQPHAGARDR